MDLVITHVHYALLIKLHLEEPMFVVLALLAVLLALHQILLQMLHATLASVVMDTTIKLKHVVSARVGQLLWVEQLNVFYAQVDAQIVHQKVTLLILHAQDALLIMVSQTVLAHYALEIKLLKEDKPFVLTVQVDAIYATVVSALHAEAITSYLTIPAKFVLIVLSH